MAFLDRSVQIAPVHRLQIKTRNESSSLPATNVFTRAFAKRHILCRLVTFKGALMSFSFGDFVKLRGGKYANKIGTIIDHHLDSDALPSPRPGYFWIRIAFDGQTVPVHVHQDEIEPAT